MPETRYHFDVLVIGAGPAGLAASWAASQKRKAVGLVSDSPCLGGQIWQHGPTAEPSPQASTWFERVRSSSVSWLAETTVIAAIPPGALLVEASGHPAEISYSKLVLATGARELFLPFPGWTLPGVLGAGGAQALSKQGWPMQGKRVVVAGSGPLLLAAADGLKKKGAHVLALVEQAPFSRVATFGLGLLRFPGKAREGVGIRFRLAGVPFLFGTWVSRAHGDNQLRAVTLDNGSRQWQVDCDLLAFGYGLVPNTELAQALGCTMADDSVQVDTLQGTNQENIYAAGEVTGVGGAERALLQGEVAGLAAAGDMARAERLSKQRARWERFRFDLATAFSLRPEVLRLAEPETIVCRCEDVTFGRLAEFTSWRQAKLHSRCGMGPCQGRVCGAATRELFGWGMESVRPPIFPCRVGTLLRPR